LTGYRISIILLSLIPALINIGIFIYAFYFLRRDKLVAVFSLVVLTSATWQVSDTLLRVIDDIEIATHIYRVLSYGTYFLLPASVHFALLYTNSFNKRKTPLILTALYLPAIFFYFTNAFELDKGQLVLTKIVVFLLCPTWSY